MLRVLTDFADQAVVLPFILAIGATLFIGGWRRGAIAWTVAAGATLGLMLLLKLGSMACGPTLLRTPSGHTAAAAIVAGSFAALFLTHDRCVGTAAAALAAAALIGALRLVAGVHTMPEVLLGASVGTAGAICFACTAGPRPADLRLRPVLIVAVAVIAAFHGNRLRAEPRIWRAANWISHELGVCRGATGQVRPYVSSIRTMSSSAK